jgi:hypothetical protein
MTFQESDYPNLKKDIINLIDKYKNPALVVEILKEIWETHKRIPIYPGIISMCLAGMVKKKKIKELTPGEKVLVKTGNQEILGTVKSIGKKEILLENPDIVRSPKNVKVKNKAVKELLAMERDVLEKIWPTLVFKGEE